MNRHFATIVLSVIMTLLLPAPVFAAPVSYDDPLESVNRKIFAFNDAVGTYALKPVAKTYQRLTPRLVQTMVDNFLENLGEFRNIASAGLQLHVDDALTSSGRLLLNSSFGILGLIDVATPLGLDRRYSDFGLTFAHWGIPSGPYLVLPLLGPATLRSGVGRIPNAYVSPVTYYDDDTTSLVLGGVDVVNRRTQLLSAEGLIIGERYTFIRDSYLQRREFLITGQQPEDDF